jgi:hypothetical protein
MFVVASPDLLSEPAQAYCITSNWRYPMFYVINPDGRSIDFQGHTVGESHESLHSAIAGCKAIIDDCVRLRLAPMFPRIAESRETL